MGDRIGTIGVYGGTADGFLGRLREFGADALIDVRRRRGVRGHEYAWANAGRLQELLQAAGIAYVHCLELAPTEAIRDIVRADDRRAGRSNRARTDLSPEYVAAYGAMLAERGVMDAARVAVTPYAAPVLFCVEADPAACHRSIAADALARDLSRDRVDL
jgi:uncharacterized protein (DUF488 family)